MKNGWVFIALVLGLAGRIALCDTLFTTDGKRYEGTVEEGGAQVLLTTREGVELKFASDQVLAVQYSKTLEDEYQLRRNELSAKDANGHYRLALWCQDNGLAAYCRAELEKTVAINADHEQAREMLGYAKIDGNWVSGEDLLTSKGMMRIGDEWLTKDEAAFRSSLRDDAGMEKPSLKQLLNKFSKLAEGDQAGGLTLVKEVQALNEEDQYSVYRRALGSSNAQARAVAAEQLRNFDLDQVRELLTKTALLDTRKAVCEAAVASLRITSQAAKINVAKPFMETLETDPRMPVRMNALRALRDLGGADAVRLVAKQITMTYGGGARNHLAVTINRAYIQDYDVQIATAASIYDPVISTVQEGWVLDVTSQRVTRSFILVYKEAARDALESLIGDEVPRDEKAFAEWWELNKNKYE